MTQIIVVETIRAKPNKSALLKQALLEMVPLSRQENGCISYEVTESEEKNDVFLVLMRWETKASLAAHEKSEHILEFVRKYDNVLYGEVTESHWLSC